MCLLSSIMFVLFSLTFKWYYKYSDTLFLHYKTRSKENLHGTIKTGQHAESERSLLLELWLYIVHWHTDLIRLWKLTVLSISSLKSYDLLPDTTEISQCRSLKTIIKRNLNDMETHARKTCLPILKMISVFVCHRLKRTILFIIAPSLEVHFLCDIFFREMHTV